ncbi:hypothetical protein SAMN02745213_01769 [Succinivibrio dextrinosolvens DSM 3072]|uniref:Uncharacterized protein n=1 Tax=Succinivibrio dextrinosolvens DSM 3072 TaxID=1123324 RepID=A0A1T4VMM3_9GAMM|nr:hypothetical protein [Succinivibrio dextrinosolvens]SKA66187.1 hypothetical protein SAMN02745213_01769 [Succinivibrio dextrinosolvens DSM 3072]
MKKLATILLCFMFINTKTFAATGSAIVAVGAAAMAANHKKAEEKKKEIATTESQRYRADKLVITCRAHPSLFSHNKNAFSDAIEKCEDKLKQIIPDASLGDVLYIRDEKDFVYIDYEVVRTPRTEN